MTLERKNQDEALNDYLDDNIVDLMDSHNLDRDTAEEVNNIMNDLDLNAQDALEVYKAVEQGNPES